MGTLDRDIGRKIKEARLGKGLTQGQLAKLVHTCQPEINRIEKGKRNISVEHLVQFSSSLERDILFFLSDYAK
jgi:transcriptional regulator with XRE-family HTH domain